MKMAKAWEDGIDLLYPPNTTLWLSLDLPAINPQEYIWVGQQKWPVNAMPLELSGW
jgi:hypothetical protein